MNLHAYAPVSKTGSSASSDTSANRLGILSQLDEIVNHQIYIFYAFQGFLTSPLGIGKKSWNGKSEPEAVQLYCERFRLFHSIKNTIVPIRETLFEQRTNLKQHKIIDFSFYAFQGFLTSPKARADFEAE